MAHRVADECSRVFDSNSKNVSFRLPSHPLYSSRVLSEMGRIISALCICPASFNWRCWGIAAFCSQVIGVPIDCQKTNTHKQTSKQARQHTLSTKHAASVLATQLPEQCSSWAWLLVTLSCWLEGGVAPVVVVVMYVYSVIVSTGDLQAINRAHECS